MCSKTAIAIDAKMKKKGEDQHEQESDGVGVAQWPPFAS